MDEGSTLAGLDFSPIIDALTSAITPAQIIQLLSTIIAFGLPFVMMWFGLRKVIKIFRAAVMGGHIAV